MTQAIIRGIWGDGKGHSDQHIEQTVRAASRNGNPVDKVYCFGRHNKRILERCGYTPVMLDRRPIASPRIPESRARHEGRALRWGVSHWWHKFKIIEAATQEFDHVLWQDFDVRLVRSLPPDFWEELKSGAAIRAPLTIQLHGSRGAWWRIPNDKRSYGVGFQPPLTKVCTPTQAKVVPAGGYVYVRGAEMGQRLMDLQNEYVRWNNQPILALLIDQMYDGWPGIQAYMDRGHEVRGYYYGASVNRPRYRATYWISGKRQVQWHARKTKRYWRSPCSNG